MTPSQNNNFVDRIFKIDGSEAKQAAAAAGRDRRIHRRHDLEQQSIDIKRVDSSKQDAAVLGRIMDISAGGVRIRASKADVRSDQQIRVRLELPDYAGICPFVDTTGE